MKTCDLQFVKRIYIALVILFAALLSFSACGDKNKGEPGSEISKETKLVNKMIYDYSEAYLWIDKIDTRSIDINNEPDPKALFEKYMYRTLDKWSYITDEADVMMEQYQGVETTFGLNLAFGEFSNAKGTYFAIVRFVYPDSPAQQAGIKRGDLIITANNQSITEKNYMDLYYASSISVQLASVAGSTIQPTGVSKSMTAKKMYEDPIQAYKIIEKDSHKIGYLCYTDYVIGSHEKLDAVFQEFKDNNVTDVVLDLRYNPGGAALSAKYLSSILAPETAVKSKSIYLKQIWNNLYSDYYKQEGVDLNEYFDDKVKVNMNLDKLYVLTTSGTASASEATIVALEAYLDVVRIGGTTHGKYCGAALLPLEGYKIDPSIKNWGMSLVIYKFANNKGFTDFTNGLEPKYQVEEDWKNYRDFGDENDPLFAKAIALITGVETRSSVITRATEDNRFKMLDSKLQPDNNRKGGMLEIVKQNQLIN